MTQKVQSAVDVYLLSIVGFLDVVLHDSCETKKNAAITPLVYAQDE